MNGEKPNLKHVLELFLSPKDDLSNVDIKLDQAQVIKLNRFFIDSEEFDFSSYEDCFCGFTLFHSFSSHVTKENKDMFLKAVWDMFYDYRAKTGWHNWSGQFSPGGGALFAEGFLKYELCLAGTKPSFENMGAYDSEWFDTTTAFLAAVKRFSSQSTYGLFIHQFAQNLAKIMKKEAPSLGYVQAMTEKEDQETIIKSLASLAGLSTQDFDKLGLSLIPDGDIEVWD